ncbi:ABC transporter permease [Leekyejoonella antrihumi]|uniref:ABC transporter permease n=1 Tax=Leekyejoonella antrihumi TaxID=1660198 RepID=A0A563E3S6_9MICO|nr:ABC transporter permease [Leekyejoonella antrihumi]TWP37178.1 ABC transporter permease [Leekyejoonella antrihumi]
MTTSQASPSMRPTGTAARARSQARFETHTLLANGEQLVVSIVLPAMALVAMALTTSPSLGAGRRIDLVMPGVLALAIVSTAFTGQAIATGFDRRYGVLRLFGVTPLGRSGLLAGKAAAVLVVVVVQTIILAIIGLAMGWNPDVTGIALAIVFALLGCWAWVALALLLAGALRAEAVLAVANLIWVLLAAVGGLLFPTDRMPSGVADVVRLLPSGALGDGLRAALTDHDGRLLLPLVVLVAWGCVATVLTARTFKWSD